MMRPCTPCRRRAALGGNLSEPSSGAPAPDQGCPGRHCPGVGGRAAAAKGLPAGDPLAGEEWLAGPCALMVGCNGLIATLEQLEEKTFLRRIPLWTLADGRLALRVCPARSGIGCFCLVFALRYGCSQASTGPISTAMRRGHTTSRLRAQGSWRVVLGAGNVASIAPLDVLHKLFIENQVCLLKLNPVNDYLHDLLAQALAPLIAMDALRIVTGDAGRERG